MFTHLLPNSYDLFSVKFTSYSLKHYLSDFKKKYKGKQWDLTQMSIIEDLSRLRMENNTTQLSGQIDELKYSDGMWLAKYDFKIAGTKQSTKDSGNRCILFINNDQNTIDILLIYNKNNLVKNTKETKYIFDVLKENYPNLIKQLEN